MNEEQLKDIGTNMIGNYGWMFVVGFVVMLFRSTIEGLVISFKLFFGKGLNTDDIIFIWIDKKYAARIVRVGVFKTVLTLYEVSTTHDGEPYISGGEKFEIQNHKLPDYVITKPMTKVDLTGWKNGFNGNKKD